MPAARTCPTTSLGSAGFTDSNHELLLRLRTPLLNCSRTSSSALANRWRFRREEKSIGGSLRNRPDTSAGDHQHTRGFPPPPHPPARAARQTPVSLLTGQTSRPQ